MSNELFTINGNRKYLSAEELTRFLIVTNAQERVELRTFCLVLAHTGCRISEALALTVDNIDLSEKVIIFRTLKQRNKIRYRAVPVPDSTFGCLRACSPP